MDGTIDFIVLEHDDVAGCALIAGAVDGVVPAIDGHNTPYIVAMGYDHPTRNWEDCTLFDDIVKAKLAYEGLRGREYPLDVAMRRDDSATLNARALTDAELAIEIEKAGAAMVEHVDAHMAHVHGLGGSEDDSAAYYAARKRHADLRLEKDRRLHASIDLGTSDYHRGSRTWARATPFGDITRAKVVFEHRVGRDYAPNEGRLHDDEVIACRWRRGDIAGVLEESLDYPIPATKENIDIAIGQIAHVQDRLIEDGWREIVDSIREERLDLGLGSSQADNFYRGVYDVTAHHNSMFWPSGDGSAVHVSHCRLGDGPSFGLTVRTIPAAAIGNETVTFEKIDRLGGKIELCVDSIDQDIEKVRAFASSSPAVRAFVEPLCAYIPAPSDSVGEQKRDISPYLRQTARRCQRISHPIDPPETASAAASAAFGGAAALPAHRGYKHQ